MTNQSSQTRFVQEVYNNIIFTLCCRTMSENGIEEYKCETMIISNGELSLQRKIRKYCTNHKKTQLTSIIHENVVIICPNPYKITTHFKKEIKIHSYILINLTKKGSKILFIL